MSTQSLLQQVSALEERQMREWPIVRDNYAALDAAALREVWLGNSLVVLQHNAARRQSAAAKVDAGSVAARRCFLCRENQPSEQEVVPWGDGRYKIQVNPYPIFAHHLTISDATHTPQSLANPKRIADMLRLAHELPGYVVFYNGPRCGASAPDHFHFQAGDKGMMPLCAEVHSPLMFSDENRIDGNEEGGLAFTTRMGRFLFMIKTEQRVHAELLFARLQLAMMMTVGTDEEPMQNLLCWTDGDQYCLAVFPRRRHRPACYGTGEGQLLLSPGSTEMGGLWAVPDEGDYDVLDAAALQALYNELCIDNATAVKIIDNYYRWARPTP